MQHYSNSVFSPDENRHATRVRPRVYELRANKRARAQEKNRRESFARGQWEFFQGRHREKTTLDSLSVWYRWLIKLQRECYYSAFVLLHLKTAPKFRSLKACLSLCVCTFGSLYIHGSTLPLLLLLCVSLLHAHHAREYVWLIILLKR